MKVNKKKAISTLVTILMAFTMIAVPLPTKDNLSVDNQTSIVQMLDANAVDVRKGRFNNSNWSGWTYIYANQGRDWRGNWYNKTPKIKLCTFDLCGWRSGGTMDVEVQTSSGKYIGTYVISSGNKLKLSGGYWSYRVRIKPHNYGSGIWNSGRNFTNIGKCVYWSIDSSTNCYFR